MPVPEPTPAEPPATGPPLLSGAPVRGWDLRRRFLPADRDSATLAASAALAAVLLGLRYVQVCGVGLTAAAVERDDPRPFAYRLDVNAAAAVEFAQLDGIGPTLGRAIVDHRDRIGRFPTPDGLLGVKGIGPRTLAKIRPHLTARPPGRTVAAVRHGRAR